MAEFQDVQLFVKDTTVISSSNFGIGLDLLTDSPIKITKSIQSIEEPTATTSSYSQVFRVPNTPTNSKFFKGVYNVNSVTWDATKKVPAYINVNGAFFMSGTVTLDNIIYSPDIEKIEYELIFLGETNNFGSTIAPKELSDLNLSELSHPLNYNNIQLSWAGGLLNGNVVYPLAEYGYTYDTTTKQPNISTLAVYNATTGVKGFTNSANPLNQTQFKPFIKAKYIWDQIFEEAGFTYTSNFLSNSQLFNKIYMISSNTSSSNAEMAISPYLDAAAGYFITYLYTTGQNLVFNFPYEFTDTANNWDFQNSIYKAVNSGSSGSYTYTFKIKNFVLYASGGAGIGSPPSSYYRPFQIKAVYNIGAFTYTDTKTAYAYVGNSGTYFNQFCTVYADTTGFSTEFTWNLNLSTGSEVRFYINLNDSTQISAGASVVSASLTATGPTIVDPAGLMPNQTKQVEYVRGINDRFKLMWEPDPDNPKNFLIEPWVDWIKGGTQKDWSDKLDRNYTVTITPLFKTQPREIIYKDSEESDLYNFSYQQANKQTFGQLNRDSGIEILTGSREIKSIFAPAPLGPIGNSTIFPIPHFAKDTETERQPIQIKPRLMFYNGTGPAPINWYMKNDAGTSVQQTVYPIASSFSSYPFNTNSMDLNWTNSNQYFGDYNNSGNGRTPITAYTTYWQTWFNFTYSPYGRVMEATFNLSINDLRSLKFNDKIFVKDSWWLPIEVKDYNLNQARQNVKVKLVKLGDDVGVSVGQSAPGIYMHTNIIYGRTGCGACCTGEGINQVLTVYTNNINFSSSSVIYADPGGTVPADAGGYRGFGTSDALVVGLNGAVTSVVLCSSCVCEGTLYAFNVCSSTSTCGACCCSLFGETIYGNGTTLASSTSIYGNNTGTMTLIPYKWYRNASATVQVGADGTTIVAFGTCSGCYCGDVPPSE